MKRILFLIIILSVLFQSVSADAEEIYRAADGVDTSGINEMLGGFSFEDLAQSLAEGEGIPLKSYGQRIIDFLLGEVKAAFGTLAIAAALSMLCGMLTGLCFNKGAANLTFFICFALITGIVTAGFSEVAQMGQRAVESMTVFMSAAVPSFGVLGVASGNSSAIAASAPMMLMATASGYVINYIAIPAVYMSLAMSLVGNLGEKISLDKLSKLVRKTALWIVCGVETLFCAVIGITGFAAGTVGGVMGKTVKFTMSSTIPVVGSILSDAADALAGSALIIKNTAGAAGMILILLLFAVPVLKTAATLFAYKLCAAVVQPVSDKRITASLSDIADILSCLTGMLIAVGAASIISLGLLLGGVK